MALAAGFAATLDCSFAPAMAQGFFFWNGDSLPRAAPREIRHVARPRHAGGKKTSPTAGDKTGATTSAREAKADAPQLDRPLFLVASIADQHVSIYNHHGLVVRSAISTGMAGHPTPKGIFSIIGRERFHRSNIYSGAPMPFMQRITWSGVAMHLGVVPGHPASHGCIRLPAAFAAKLWGMTRIGERVVISPHEVTPVEFEHALLPQPKLRTSAEPEKSESGAPVAATPASAAPPPKAEKPEIETGGDAANAAKADPAADQKPSPAVAEASADKPHPQAEQPKVEAEPAAAVKAETAPVEAQKEASVATDAPDANPARPAEQPKIEAGAEKTAPSASAPPSAVAEPAMVNPHQYAQQLKAKAVAEAAAAVKAVKALTLDVGAKQKEAARAAAELSAAEAAQAWASRKADAAAATYDAVTASAASQRDPAETAEREASAGDALAKTKADRLTIAYGRALLVEDAALLAKTNADAVLADATAKLERARTAANASESEFADVDRRLDEARTAAATAVAAQKDAERRAAPISMLISKKEGRIYVRQGLAPLFDAPIDIRDPKTPLGSHLYVATAASDDGKSLKWHVVSMPVHLGEEPVTRRKTASNEAGMGWSLRTTTSPTEALERVDIPKDVRDRIGDRLWTGASLIISDQPVSSETGAVGTDLTIKLR
ncbi:MAG: L,D-transpeptidase family protein [Methylocystis sp.]|uniref:L,D-transpeptidase family protein n=1 Tax=Methylocystis sp. TaxID=1911079 RepID=UPI00392D826E